MTKKFIELAEKIEEPNIVNILVNIYEGLTALDHIRAATNIIKDQNKSFIAEAWELNENSYDLDLVKELEGLIEILNSKMKE